LRTNFTSIIYIEKYETNTVILSQTNFIHTHAYDLTVTEHEVFESYYERRSKTKQKLISNKSVGTTLINNLVVLQNFILFPYSFYQ